MESPESISNLISQHRAKIYTSIYLLVKDKSVAEDILHDAIVKIIDTVNDGGYAEDGKFSSWAMRLAHNLCIDHFRRTKRRRWINASDKYDVFDFINVYENSVAEKLMQKQSERKVVGLLEFLPDDQRDVVLLRYYADLDFKEIAKLTNCSINTALGRMRYALLNLRELVTEWKVVL